MDDFSRPEQTTNAGSTVTSIASAQTTNTTGRRRPQSITRRSVPSSSLATTFESSAAEDAEQHRLLEIRLSQLDLFRDLPDPGLHPALRASTSATQLNDTPKKSQSRVKGLRRLRSDLGSTSSSTASSPTTNTARLPHSQRFSIHHDTRRDSGLAPSLKAMASVPDLQSTNRGASAPAIPPTTSHSNCTEMSSPVRDIPSIVLPGDQEFTDPAVPSVARSSTQSHHPPLRTSQSAEFHGIMSTDIPTGTLEDPFSSDNLSFSKRGSILWSNEKARSLFGRTASTNSIRASNLGLRKSISFDSRTMSVDETRLSERVRSMYEQGDELPSGQPTIATVVKGESGASREPNTPTLLHTNSLDPLTSRTSTTPSDAGGNNTNLRPMSIIQKEPWELAGGLEDWKDIDFSDTDRYGFIHQNRAGSRGSSKAGSPTPGTPVPQSDLQTNRLAPLPTVDEASVDNSPQRASRMPTVRLRSHRLSVTSGTQANRPISRSSSRRGAPSIYSNRSRTSIISSKANKGRRWADEAGNMLTIQPGLDSFPAHANESTSPSKAALERKREAKWFNMATSVPRKTSAAGSRGPTSVGGGQDYSFDTTSEKLISRTWKGIPDRWRGSAWYWFLTSSARRQQGSSFVEDDDLVEAYHAYQECLCPDDVQIDMDVPRTIGGHVLFRRRYRGGQRLLFRILRALSLHFPSLGYVQGMASIVATLLCYFEEERAFVMAVRLWECRGLGYLYDTGFEGLMAVLADFDAAWLAGLPVARSLDDLAITSTSFGTRWYLTLFGYSIPFAAQLRVWDVFMLLGSGRAFSSADSKARAAAAAERALDGRPPASKRWAKSDANFDILHAVSAALLDGLQDILLGADFENAMRVLTQPVPVGREDVLMRVALREHKEMLKRRKKAAA